MSKISLLSCSAMVIGVLLSLKCADVVDGYPAYPRALELTGTYDMEAYPSEPNEVLPIQPILLYPKARKMRFEGRNSEKDAEIIYVKLLNRLNYRPQLHRTNDIVKTTKELTVKDIFFVKALANGKFNSERLKWYQVPEFYAISVYHKGDQR